MEAKSQIDKVLEIKNLSQIKDLAELLGIKENVISGWIFRNKISKEGLHLLKSVGITKDTLSMAGRSISESVKSSPPTISPPQADCDKISAEMETVKGMMEFYRGELEKAKNEIINLYKDKFEMQARIVELEADARQQSGRSVVERGNTANALEIQKVMA